MNGFKKMIFIELISLHNDKRNNTIGIYIYNINNL